MEEVVKKKSHPCGMAFGFMLRCWHFCVFVGNNTQRLLRQVEVKTSSRQWELGRPLPGLDRDLHPVPFRVGALGFVGKKHWCLFLLGVVRLNQKIVRSSVWL